MAHAWSGQKLSPSPTQRAKALRLPGPRMGSPHPVLTDSTAFCTGSPDRDREPGRPDQTAKGSPADNAGEGTSPSAQPPRVRSSLALTRTSRRVVCRSRGPSVQRSAHRTLPSAPGCGQNVLGGAVAGRMLS